MDSSASRAVDGVDDESAVATLRRQVASLEAQLLAERAFNRVQMQQLRAEWVAHAAATAAHKGNAPSATAAAASVSSAGSSLVVPGLSARRLSGSSPSTAAQPPLLHSPLLSPEPEPQPPCACPRCHRYYEGQKPPARGWRQRWRIHFTTCHGCMLLVPLLLLGGAFLYTVSAPHVSALLRLRDAVDHYAAQFHRLQNLKQTAPVQRMQAVQAKLRDMRVGDAFGSITNGHQLCPSSGSTCPVTSMLAQQPQQPVLELPRACTLLVRPAPAVIAAAAASAAAPVASNPAVATPPPA